MDTREYWQGRTVTVYHKATEYVGILPFFGLLSTEVCNLGCKHKVEFYEVKRITVVDIVDEFIKALNYTSDGTAPVLYAKDTQGRIYRSAPGWDWAVGRNWTRGKEKYFFTDKKPYANDFSIPKDLTGKVI